MKPKESNSRSSKLTKKLVKRQNRIILNRKDKLKRKLINWMPKESNSRDSKQKRRPKIKLRRLELLKLPLKPLKKNLRKLKELLPRLQP